MTPGGPLPVRIDPLACLYGEGYIAIGDGSRIDAFVVITAGPGRVSIGRRVHVGAGVQLFGTAGIDIEDFVNLSGRTSVYSTSDHYTSGAVAGPLVPDDVREVTEAPVRIRRHALVGAGAVILPGVELGWGCAVGALSLVTRDVAPGDVVAGAPARPVARRDLLRLRELDRGLAAATES